MTSSWPGPPRIVLIAAQNKADKVFVVLPDTYEDGLPILSWVLGYFPCDKIKVIITHVMVSRVRGLWHQLHENVVMDRKHLVLDNYLSYCATCKFQAEKFLYRADDIAQGIMRVIALHGAKNLVMESAANSDMTDLASEIANKVMQEASPSCKLWFVSDGNLIFTREVNSDKLTPARKHEERSQWNGQSTVESSSSSGRSNSESETGETKLANKLEQKEQQIRQVKEFLQREKQELKKNLQREKQELKEILRREKQEHEEILQREKQEKDQLRRQIEELKHEILLSEEIEQVKIENELLRNQRDEYFNQIQVANERRLALEKQVTDFELVVKDLIVLSSSAGDRFESLQADYYNLQQERDNLVRKTEELSIQRENMPSGPSTAFNSEFSLEELQQATQNFSESLKIGQGGFGSVYKGSLRQTTVAIKLLHSESLQGVAQFQQEITILTKVRHPNLVTLIGACSEVSALVYEYLSNGSLEDRLTCANNTPPLTWQARTRIIGEICLALIFLHSNKPQLVVHGDLKPENILLDTNLVSKLSDFGISRLLKQPDTNTTAFFQTTHPAGTFAYIDPEYLSTGILTPKSDIYSFGIIILRLLTRKPPLYIARLVQGAMRSGILLSVIDESAGSWPFEQAKELAKIALRCAEVSKSQRPDLVSEVWAVVEPLMKAAAAYVEPHEEECIPSHFICPILQDVMQNPYIAADGFTYEADAIRQWLSGGHNTSPMSNLPLPHSNLTPNYVLRSAIQEWLQRHPQS
ncbi:U-box domain-containing protein kinase family protein [Rhynchospora pubera]|uniref:RING-type E3 ubiquitin transferase n=1 Tax=Rhynchospora pubera TaxID=906938 RepID=A0AAV8ETE7_9POAL|nr:U-box domain-containing protein kinase family protein [Rhynchospora pubera]